MNSSYYDESILGQVHRHLFALICQKAGLVFRQEQTASAVDPISSGNSDIWIEEHVSDPNRKSDMAMVPDTIESNPASVQRRIRVGNELDQTEIEIEEQVFVDDAVPLPSIKLVSGF